MTNDADRDAFEAWWLTKTPPVLTDKIFTRCAWLAGAAHARQPGEPVATLTGDRCEDRSPAAEEAFRRGAEAPGWDCIGDAVNAVRQAIDAQQVRSNRIEQALATVIVNLKRTKDYNDTVPAIIKWWEEEEMPRIRALATPNQGGV